MLINNVNDGIIHTFIIQYGIQCNIQYGTYDKYYPIAFPNYVIMVQATDWASPTIEPFASSIGVDYSGWNVVRFVAHFQNHTPRGFCWVAFGW